MRRAALGLSPTTRRSDAHHRIPTSGTCKTGYTETTLLPKAEQEKLEKVLPYSLGISASLKRSGSRPAPIGRARSFSSPSRLEIIFPPRCAPHR
jgi:hypothetical protein